MKRLLFVTVLIAVMMAMVATNAVAQKTSNMAQAFDAGSLSFPLPVPQLIHLDPENDMWPAYVNTAPPPLPGGPPVPTSPTLVSVKNRPIMDIGAVLAKSNGLQTVFALNFSVKTDMKVLQANMVGSMFIQAGSSQNGNSVNMNYGNDLVFNPPIQQNAEISFWDYPRNGMAQVCNWKVRNSCRSVPVTISGQTLTVVVNNDDIGSFADGRMKLAIAIGDQDGPIDVAPNSSYMQVTGVRDLTLSPESATMITSQSFDIGLIIEADNPSAPFQKFVFYDDQDLTAAFEGSQIVGNLPAGGIGIQTPSGKQNFRGGKSIRYRVPAGSMSVGYHSVGVMVIGTDGIASKQVEFVVVPTTDTSK